MIIICLKKLTSEVKDNFNATQPTIEPFLLSKTDSGVGSIDESLGGSATQKYV